MDVERWVNTFAPDAVSHDPVGTPPLQGHDALRRFLTGIVGSFASIGLTEHCVFVNSDTAAVKWTGKAVGKIGLVHAYWNPEPVMAIAQS